MRHGNIQYDNDDDDDDDGDDDAVIVAIMVILATTTPITTTVKLKLKLKPVVSTHIRSNIMCNPRATVTGRGAPRKWVQASPCWAEEGTKDEQTLSLRSFLET